MLTDLIAAAAAALSFLTVLPAPRTEWTPARLRYFPVVLPLAGLVVGGLGALLFAGFSCWGASATLRSVLMALFYLFITGGLHMDGLMDTCDAVFSRQGREERLRILSDASAGAFAVMGCVTVLLLKIGAFSELLGVERINVSAALTFLPVYSRLGVGVLFYLPFAREDGLALTLGKARLPAGRLLLLAGGAALTAAAISFLGPRWLVVPLTGGVFLHFYKRWCVRVFGGITGDLLGAFVELSETLMLLALVFA